MLGPRLLDVDDWSYGSHALSFYVMEYVKGQPLLLYLKVRVDRMAVQAFASHHLERDLEKPS